MFIMDFKALLNTLNKLLEFIIPNPKGQATLSKEDKSLIVISFYAKCVVAASHVGMTSKIGCYNCYTFLSFNIKARVKHTVSTF